jgi:hypothetical protein
VDEALLALAPGNVAALGEHGLLVFALLLTGAAWLALRRAGARRS